MESKSLKIGKGALLVAASTIIIAVAQVFLKKGADIIDGTLKSIFLNPWIIFGFIFYIVAAVFLIVALKYGNLNTLYPIVGLGYVWVCLFSFFIFKETILLVDIFGIILIICGVAILGVDKNE